MDDEEKKVTEEALKAFKLKCPNHKTPHSPPRVTRINQILADQETIPLLNVEIEHEHLEPEKYKEGVWVFSYNVHCVPRSVAHPPGVLDDTHLKKGSASP